MSNNKFKTWTNCEFLNQRFEVYFFLYFIGYVLVWRLNYEYISAKYLHNLNVDGGLEQNITTMDVSGLIVPNTVTDIGQMYCQDNTTVATTEAVDLTFQTMKGIERESLKVYAALLIPSITVTFIYGLVSDFTGKRKFMMSLSSFSNALYSFVIVIDYYIGKEPGQRYLILGAVAAGCFGNWAATTVALTTYIADVTKPKKRFLRMGIMIVIMKVAYAAFEGPLVYWIKTKGFQPAIWFTFAATGLACSLQVQVMDESQATNRDYRDFELGQFYYWLHSTKFKVIFDRYFILLVLSYSCVMFIVEGYYTRLIYSTYTIIVCEEYNILFGYMHYIAWNLIACVGVIIVLIPIFRQVPDALLGIIGMVSTAAGLIFLPFCTQEWMYYTAFAMMFLHQVPYIVFLTLASKHTDCETQAIGLTFLYCCGGIARLLAMILNHFIFHEIENVSDMNNLLLWIHAALLVIPAGFLIALWRTSEKNYDEKDQTFLNGNLQNIDQEESNSIHDRLDVKLK